MSLTGERISRPSLIQHRSRNADPARSKKLSALLAFAMSCRSHRSGMAASLKVATDSKGTTKERF
jgi:hypothetical protein